MNRSIKHFLRLSAILTCISSMGQRGLAGTAEPSLKITVHIYNYAHVESETLIRAERDATRIYRKIGVETVWVDHPLIPNEKQPDPPCHRTSKINLNILPRAIEHANIQSGSLGVAPGAGRNRDRVYVFYDRVEILSRKQIVAVARGKTARLATTAQILGYSMAHEVGHLLGLDAHFAIGIMRADWRPNDLLDLAYGDLGFTPQQAVVIRTEVRIRQRCAATSLSVQESVPQSPEKNLPCDLDLALPRSGYR